jgi:hypothetical protein
MKVLHDVAVVARREEEEEDTSWKKYFIVMGCRDVLSVVCLFVLGVVTSATSSGTCPHVMAANWGVTAVILVHDACMAIAVLRLRTILLA